MLLSTFFRARRLLAALERGRRDRLRRAAEQVRAAQQAFDRQARQALARCADGCGGLCCRNVELDAVIGLADFAYLLLMHPSLGPVVEDGLRRLPPLVASDCVFLQDGTGPCLFPTDLRPLHCKVTFCFADSRAEAAGKDLARAFGRLSRRLWWARMAQALGRK